MSQPGWLDPELATLTDDRFSDPAWIYERKFDGERCLAFRDGARLRLMTRNQQEVTGTYPEIAEAMATQRASDFIVDGEVVAFDRDETSFSRLQRRLGVRDPGPDLIAGVPVYIYLFDVLWADGHDVRSRPLLERKDVLRNLLSFGGPLRFAEHRDTDGEAYYREACQLGWEGLIAKRADSPGRAQSGLAEVQVPERPGVRHWRLHRPAALPRRVRRAAARLLRRRRRAGLRRQGRHRLHQPGPDQPARHAGRRRAAFPGLRARPRPAPVPRALGRAPARRRGRVQRVDPGRRTPAPQVPGPAPGQGPGRRRAGDALREHL